MPTERAFVESAQSGITISLIFAFLILLLATGNLLQSILALVCVIVIIASVLAIMQMQGWQLGIIESIAVVITIGLSVDYVIHLSTDYMHSPAESRNNRMQQAFAEMGVSILSGSITTFGAGAFLLGGNLLLFKKFGILITSTIAISFLVAMLFFGAIVHIAGPEHGFTNLFADPPKRLPKRKSRPMNEKSSTAQQIITRTSKLRNAMRGYGISMDSIEKEGGRSRTQETGGV